MRARLMRKKQPISHFVLLLSIACHGAAFWIAYPLYFQQSVPFLREYLVFLLLAAVCSVAVYLVDADYPVLAVHAVRFVSIIIMSRILEAGHPTLVLLFSIPFYVDTALYFPLRAGIAVNSAYLVLALLGDLRLLRTEAVLGVVKDLLPFIVVSAATAGLAATLIYYRERVVRDERLIASLDLAVTNLSTANREFQLYAENAQTKSASNERNRITRELHDVFGYALTNVIMAMNAAKVLLRDNPRELVALLDVTRDQAESALTEMRQTLYRLRSITDVPPKGLTAIRRLGWAFQEATGVEVVLNYGNLPISFGEEIDLAMYRFIQEGLTNAFRHGRARAVHINLWDKGASVEITVRDNGRGAASLESGIGLKGMAERLASLGGHFLAHNVADGFEVRATIPKTKEGAR